MLSGSSPCIRSWCRVQPGLPMPACKEHDTATQKSTSGACLNFSPQLSLGLVLIQQRTKANKQEPHFRRGKGLEFPRGSYSSLHWRANKKTLHFKFLCGIVCLHQCSHGSSDISPSHKTWIVPRRCLCEGLHITPSPPSAPCGTACLGDREKPVPSPQGNWKAKAISEAPHRALSSNQSHFWP